ncbi:hypothetical protein BSG1_03890 [Bacillus sp. SG-1]|nr:hypothetical protein BSG1_03890 [Bacillus sp. SG-1]
MKGLTVFLMFFHILITVFWLANSSYLFSLWGVFVWLTSIVLGFVAYKQMKEPVIVKTLILISSAFMVFLLIISGLILWAVTSMA